MSMPTGFIRCHGCDFEGLMQPRPVTLEYSLPSGEKVEGYRRFAWCRTCENVVAAEEQLSPAAIRGQIANITPKSASLGGFLVRAVDRALGGGQEERREIERLTARLRLATIRKSPPRCLSCGQVTLEELNFDQTGTSSFIHTCGRRLFVVPQDPDAPRFHFGHQVIRLDHEGRSLDRAGPKEAAAAFGTFSPDEEHYAKAIPLQQQEETSMFGFGSKPDYFSELMEYLVEEWRMRTRYASAFLSAYRKDISSTLDEGIKRMKALNIPSVAMLAMGDDPRTMAIVAQAYRAYLSDLRRGKHVGSDVEMAIWGILANRSDLVASVDRGFATFIDENWEKQYPTLFETVFVVE